MGRRFTIKVGFSSTKLLGIFKFSYSQSESFESKEFLSWLQTEGHIQKDLSSRIHAPKVPQKIPNFLSVDECLALIKNLQKHALSNKLEDQQKLVLVLLLYGGGLRVSEACELKWKDLKLKEKKLLVLGKGHKERWIVLPNLSVQYLSQLPQIGEFVFGEKSLSPRKAYEWVRTAGIEAGIIRPLSPMHFATVLPLISSPAEPI